MTWCDLLLVQCRRLQRSVKCKYTHYRSTYSLGLRGAGVTVWDRDHKSREFGPNGRTTQLALANFGSQLARDNGSQLHVYDQDLTYPKNFTCPTSKILHFSIKIYELNENLAKIHLPYWQLSFTWLRPSGSGICWALIIILFQGCDEEGPTLQGWDWVCPTK